jgi:hypothetical protein
MECANCHASLNPGARFCSACGQPVQADATIALPFDTVVCPGCGAQQPSGERYCSECGHALQQAEAPEAPLPGAARDQPPPPRPALRTRPVIIGIVMAGALGMLGSMYYLHQRDENFRGSARDGNLSSLQAYLASGINPNTRPDTDSMTALMWASYNGNTDVVGALIAAGADVNVKMSGGWTALKWAAMNGKADAVRALIDAGADVNHGLEENIDGYKGHTALLVAKSHGHAEVVRMLREAGAKE